MMCIEMVIIIEWQIPHINFSEYELIELFEHFGIKNTSSLCHFSI